MADGQHHSPTHHSHDHGHREGDTHDFAAANKQHFNENLDMFDHPDIVSGTRQMAAAIVAKHPGLFSAESTTVLDYACGAGLLSRELSPYVKSILGVDISEKVVEQYNSRALTHGLADKLKALSVELKADGHLDGSLRQFDIVLCTMAYHHFASPEDVTNILASFVKPGGSLLVVDLLTDATQDAVASMEKYKHVVPHRSGFDAQRMQEMFVGAGLTGFEFGALDSRLKFNDLVLNPFLARGVRP